MHRLERAVETGPGAGPRPAWRRSPMCGAAADALPTRRGGGRRRRAASLLRNRRREHFLGRCTTPTCSSTRPCASACCAARSRASPSTQTLELYGPPRAHGRGRSPCRSPATSGVAVATIEDVTERGRLEAMRTDFVANISHELKTPVGALALLAETLIDEDESGAGRRLAEKMVNEAHRVGRIIEDLLELSRIELGESAPPRGGAAWACWRPRRSSGSGTWPSSASITVAVTEPSRRLNVIGDRRQLVSAVANLVENGVKYSDAGSTVEVSARTDGTWVDIVVRDHGIGIPAATSTASSSASTASTAPAAARRAAPVSAWPSCATSPPTTAAPCRSRRRRARGSTFTLRDPGRARAASPSRPPGGDRVSMSRAAPPCSSSRTRRASSRR